MLHRHRRFAVGVVVLAIGSVGWFVMASATAASRSDGSARRPATMTAAILADGTTVGADAQWFVHKPSRGEYVLSFGRDVKVRVLSWDAAATVTIRPTSLRTWVIDFVQGNQPIDTAFSFTAVPKR